MKERPILFSGEMVRAILDGRKTQTRRVMKPQPPENRTPAWCGYSDTGWALEYPDGGCECSASIRCPYGFPGDRLWVREAWRVWSWHDGEPINVQYRDGMTKDCDVEDEHLADYERWEEAMWIQSGDDCKKAGMFVPEHGDVFVWPNQEDEDRDPPTRWRPSIHMPRWASRLDLTVLDVRVERLQDISEQDAVAEGIDMPIPEGPHVSGMGATHPSAVFSDLWERINAKRGYPWASNPWVWVVEFERA